MTELASIAPGLADVGAYATNNRPFVILAMGQSNMVGQDTGGSKTIQSGIKITDSVASPTSVITAAFGTAPLNNAVGGGTTSVAANCYNNMAVAFANQLRSSGMIPAGRDIVIVPNWQGAQSISSWMGSGTSSTLWVALLANLAVVAAAYPNASIKIDHVMWAQGENDNSGTYNSSSAYGTAFATLQSQLRALTQWQTTTTMSVQELGTWDNNTQQLRNDFLRTTALGYFDMWTTMVSSTGMVESSQNSGPHFDGTSLVTLGGRHFAAWNVGRINGGYYGATSYYGSPSVQPNVLTVSASGGQINEDDIRSSAFIIGSGGTITLPNPARFTSLPLYIYASAQTSLASSGGTLQAGNRGTIASLTLSSGTLWRIDINPSTGFWRATQVSTNGLGKGDFSRYVGSAAVTGAQTYTGNVALTGVALTLNGVTMTLTHSFGMDAIFFGTGSSSTLTLASGSFTFADGSTASSLTLQAGEWVWLVGGITSTSTLTTYVVSGSLRRGYTVATLPASPKQGAVAFVTDASAPTFLGTLTGGGAVVCPVFYNGTAWVAG
jgi:hypothetical protein